MLGIFSISYKYFVMMEIRNEVSKELSKQIENKILQSHTCCIRREKWFCSSKMH